MQSQLAELTLEVKVGQAEIREKSSRLWKLSLQRN